MIKEGKEEMMIPETLGPRNDRWIALAEEDCGSSFLFFLICTVRRQNDRLMSKELVEIRGELEM